MPCADYYPEQNGQETPRPAREREKVLRFENDSREPQPTNLPAHLRNEVPLLTVYQRITAGGGLVGSVVHASSTQYGR
jgi:hypothetical protein